MKLETFDKIENLVYDIRSLETKLEQVNTEMKLLKENPNDYTVRIAVGESISGRINFNSHSGIRVLKYIKRELNSKLKVKKEQLAKF
jgi:hypothetical protein